MSTNYLSLKMLEVCLNPYYNGKYSMSEEALDAVNMHCGVLILIIMENTL